MNTMLLKDRPGNGIIYPDSDGKPMADNTKQFRWIQTIAGNLEALFRDREDVFVAGDNLWYPLENRPDIRQAPDVYVVFGRPKRDRGSYRQWEENDVPITVVFEILSPGNTATELADKQAFYDDYGVEEYYIYDPDTDRLHVFLRRGEALTRVRGQIKEFTSPRLRIRFDLSGEEMVVYHPNGDRFLTLEQVKAALDQEKQRAARIVELNRKQRRSEASAEELQELERLEDEIARSG